MVFPIELTVCPRSSGAAATAGVLGAGLVAFRQVSAATTSYELPHCLPRKCFVARKRAFHKCTLTSGGAGGLQGNSQLSQQMMRARVVFQVCFSTTWARRAFFFVCDQPYCLPQAITVGLMAGSAGFIALQDGGKK